jgi:hypothetical protein
VQIDEKTVGIPSLKIMYAYPLLVYFFYRLYCAVSCIHVYLFYCLLSGFFVYKMKKALYSSLQFLGPLEQKKCECWTRPLVGHERSKHLPYSLSLRVMVHAVSCSPTAAPLMGLVWSKLETLCMLTIDGNVAV